MKEEKNLFFFFLICMIDCNFRLIVFRNSRTLPPVAPKWKSVSSEHTLGVDQNCVTADN